MSKKKDTELEILRSVYPDKNSYTIDSNWKEKPDFKIKFDNQDDSIGVEITELFRDETEARLKKDPNYFGNLIDNREYKHKDDKELLNIVQIRILDENNTVRETPAIHRKGITLNQIIENLGLRIEQKNKKLKEYDNSVKYNELIIKVQEDLLELTPYNDFVTALLRSTVIKQIEESGFHEIYFVASFKPDGNMKTPLVRLKQIYTNL